MSGWLTASTIVRALEEAAKRHQAAPHKPAQRRGRSAEEKMAREAPGPSQRDLARAALAVVDGRAGAAAQIVAGLVSLGFERGRAVWIACTLAAAARGAQDDDPAVLRRIVAPEDDRPP